MIQPEAGRVALVMHSMARASPLDTVWTGLPDGRLARPFRGGAFRHMTVEEKAATTGAQWAGLNEAIALREERAAFAALFGFFLPAFEDAAHAVEGLLPRFRIADEQPDFVGLFFDGDARERGDRIEQ